MKVLGLDPSTKTGWVVVENTDGGVSFIASGMIHFPGKAGMARIQLIGQAVGDLLTEHKPDLVVIEGYGFANKHTLVIMVEVGTSIRFQLYKSEIPWGIVAPNQLKKFVSGKGGTKKDGMMLAVYKQWNFEGTNDECDAFGLAAFGLYAGVSGLFPHLTKPQRECFQDWKAENARLYI
jgi:Holliday junction resolvasome RuvABC endonuclease subunit